MKHIKYRQKPPAAIQTQASETHFALPASHAYAGMWKGNTVHLEAYGLEYNINTPQAYPHGACLCWVVNDAQTHIPKITEAFKLPEKKDNGVPASAVGLSARGSSPQSLTQIQKS